MIDFQAQWRMSTEVYFGHKDLLPLQYAWLEDDLRQATVPAVRAQRPWIVAMGHMPMYCSNSDHDECTNANSAVRIGLPKFGIVLFSFRNLFYISIQSFVSYFFFETML